MMSEEKNYDQLQLEKKLEELSEKLDKVTNKLDHLERHSGNGEPIRNWIWALIPITAIVMWGLREIFS